MKPLDRSRFYPADSGCFALSHRQLIARLASDPHLKKADSPLAIVKTRELQKPTEKQTATAAVTEKAAVEKAMMREMEMGKQKDSVKVKAKDSEKAKETVSLHQ